MPLIPPIITQGNVPVIYRQAEQNEPAPVKAPVPAHRQVALSV